MDISKARCPDCKEPLSVTRLACPTCKLSLEGDFEVSALANSAPTTKPSLLPLYGTTAR